MAGYMNKVMLLGNLGADPEMRTFRGELVMLGDAPTGERSAGTRRAPADRRESATANAGAGGGSPPWASGCDDQDSDIPF